MNSLNFIRDNAWFNAQWKGFMSIQVQIDEDIIEPTFAIKIYEVQCNWEEFKID